MRQLLNKHRVKKLVGFGGVGVINTLIDYAIFNLLLIGFGVRPFVANLVSTSFALTFSYFANKRFVFKHAGVFDVKSAVLFICFTLFGLWIIQGAGLALIIHWVQTNYPTLYNEHEFLIANGAKLIASIASIIWNFVAYNYVVFRKKQPLNDN